ncbi:MAG: sulfatase-like hydrolase/transferase, partial [Clostridia bacterium]|nr:sulfatase-like hydrolase/transferase [Clostridia bacterium]
MNKPNILLITSDQQHYSMLGKVNDKIKTPNLDRLAEEGMLFDRAYCPNPTCSPSRASILTGMYPSEHGCWSLGTKLKESTPTMSQFLADNGYETALIGKAHFQPTKSTEEYTSIETPEYMWDIDFWRNYKDNFYGFKHIELLRNHTAEHWVGQHYVAWLEDNGCRDWRKYFFKPRGKMFNKEMGRWKIPEKYHYNSWIAERTNALLEDCKKDNKPFFIWASFPDPHYPQLVPAPYDKMYNPEDMEMPDFSFDEHLKNPPYFREVFKKVPNLAEYKESGYGVHGLHRHLFKKKKQQKKIAYAYGMVTFMDKYIGKILDKLKDLGLEDNTIIVFTTDHGDLFGQHGLIHKCIFHYEDLLRVPMICKYKNHIPKASNSDSLQSLVDLAPTLLNYCGFDIPNNMSGISQKEVWSGEKTSKRDYIICENRHEPHLMHMVSYVEKDYKITVHE